MGPIPLPGDKIESWGDGSRDWKRVRVVRGGPGESRRGVILEKDVVGGGE